MSTVRPHALLLSAALLAPLTTIGCKKKEAPPPPPPPKATATPTPEAAATADPACLTPHSTAGEAKTITVGNKTFTLQGTQLVETSKDDDDQLTILALADVKEDTPDNLANLDALLAWGKENGAELILLNGDLGENRKQIEAALSKAVDTGLPTFVIIGNREGRGVFNEAVAAVQARAPNLFNLNQLRLVSFDDGALLPVPGYHNRVYVHAEDGCIYGKADLDALVPVVASAAGKTVVLVSHGPPKQDGADALDRTLEQVNVGDPALRDFIAAQGIKFGIFSNIHEAGGKATNLAGTTLVAHEKLVDELYMSTGPVDSVRWSMNDGTESRGMGGLLTIRGKQASYKSHRLGAAAAAPAPKP